MPIGNYRLWFIALVTFIDCACCQRVQVIYEGQNLAFHCKATGIAPSATVHYQWEFDNRVIIASDDNFSLRNVRKSDEGEYKCIATHFVNNEPVVAVETTFISVRTADSIVTQDVEEGFMVRILCNVTGNSRPDGAGPLRYEWRNPNGTLVGTQWKLELGKIGMHESGVYVCRVSYEYDKKQMSTSSATRINVLKRAGIIFPGLKDNVIEALETGDIMQECKVISARPSEYNFSWYGPNSDRLISNSPYLQRDYVLRPQDQGIYRCVAKPSANGMGVVENELLVIITPLRFQISTIDEKLRLGGFTHRRVTYLPPENPRLSTRETFTYKWFGPDGKPLPTNPGSDMNVQLHRPQQFGRYYVRVSGFQSKYSRDLTSYVTLDDGIVAPTYSVVIREVSGPLYFNARLELECATNPPNPAARINWLSPDGTVVSDTSSLVFDKFQHHHQGQYTCQILLPNHVVLRQNVQLQASGTSPGRPTENITSTYTLLITQKPLIFNYDDTVKLLCVVRPTPPSVQYEWLKDNRIIGRESELIIPRFTPDDIGRYSCVARLHGSKDLSWNATISPGQAQPDAIDLIMRPRIIYQPVYTPFQIECISERPGLLPMAEFSNGAPAESDNQFTLARPDSQRLIISAPRGLSSVYNGFRIRCVLPNIGLKETTLYLLDQCPFPETQCRTRECIPTSKLCDGRPDCSDRSDESDTFCNAGITVTPTKIIVRPNEPFSLQCLSQIRGKRPHARLMYTETDVEADPRFRTERPSNNLLVIHAPGGLQLTANNTRIECYFPSEGTRIAIINVVEDGCPPGGFRCGDGLCVRRSEVCDGVPHCKDGSDEVDCAIRCLPPNIACPSGECIRPERRCDGREDCRDGFDEMRCPPRCVPPKFTCGSGECLPPGLRCDGQRDCSDGSDEYECAPTRECLPPNFQCPSGECLPIGRRCDGHVDCLDGFDERMCPPDCRPPHVRCPSGECLSAGQICDGQMDCADGWDEKSCLPTRCRSDQFTCTSGECIDQRARCDRRPDCRDGSDETGCDVGPVLRPERIVVYPYTSVEFSCVSDRVGVSPILTLENGTELDRMPGFSISRPSKELVIAHLLEANERDRGLKVMCMYPSGERTIGEIIIDSPCNPLQMMCRDRTCINRELFCNGRPDCPDGSDEEQKICATHYRCAIDQFPCYSGECIPLRQVCNDASDCKDGSDERECPEGRRCRPGEFQCSSGECIPESRRCDRRPDCYDGSDERGCAPTECRPDEFRCNSGECIRQGQRCDQRQDCRDGSDERGCEYGPVFVPQRPTVRPYSTVELECRSNRPGVRPDLTLANGTSVEQIGRFIVSRPSPEVILLRIPEVTERDRYLRFRCTYPTGETCTSEIIVETPCGPYELMCRDRTCVRENLFCDGKPDCPDGSDEREPHCAPGPVLRPDKPAIPPYGSVQLECRSNRHGVRPTFTLDNGTSVDQISRFIVSRPSTEVILVHIPVVTELDRGLRFRCVYPTGESTTIDIVIDSPCTTGEMMCRDRTCIRQERFCDGRQDCRDGSDEMDPHCVQVPRCQPHEFRCESGECIRQEGRCDGRRDCYDGSDERNCPPVSRCELGEFQCRSGECIQQNRLCDGRPDCSDGSDEWNCPSVPGCRPGEYQCRSGECIPQDRHCDNNQDCFDGSDERDCPPIYKCQPGEYQCRSGECIRQDRYCDGRPDCSDRSDEVNCPTVPACRPGQFRCESGECIDERQRCDGRQDCFEGSDERDCRRGPTVRPIDPMIRPYEFVQIECSSNSPGVPPTLVLGNGTSVDALPRFQVHRPSLEHVVVVLAYVTEKDQGLRLRCVLPTGESAETTIRIDSPCPPGQMMCRSGSCVREDSFCDGKLDCSDGSDEQAPHCDLTTPLPPKKHYLPPYSSFRIECQSSTPGTPPTLTLSNGSSVDQLPRFEVIRPSPERIVATISNLTELDSGLILRCSAPNARPVITEIIIQSPCSPTEMLCRDGSCIPRSLFCNGRPDCPDGSDEQPPHCDRPPTCRPDQFSCRSGECIDLRSRCDGRQDCYDGSDERDCARPPACRMNQFACGSGECVELGSRCDGRPDCYDGSDEKDCGPAPERCRSDQFKCGSGECIDERQRCNGLPECYDGSDERGCGSLVPIITPDRIIVRPYDPVEVTCTSNRPGISPQLRLYNGTLVENLPTFEVTRPNRETVIARSSSLTEKDRGMTIQCLFPTGEMSQATVVIDSPCAPMEAMCRDGTCLHLSVFCDGQSDCPDGSDEREPHCFISGPTIEPKKPKARPYGTLEISCESHQFGIRPQFVMANGTLLEHSPRFQVRRPTLQKVIAILTDVTEDDHGLLIRCQYRTGESVDASITVDTPCRPDERMCRDGSCRPREKFCDGRPDCADGSDEVAPRCVTERRCPAGQFECREGYCLDMARKCDGRRDCPGGSDEENCAARCTSEQFECRNKQCVDKRQRCDGRYDCSDGSDEADCAARCTSQQFECRNKQCVDKRQRCDGRYDCSDGSDETDCDDGPAITPDLITVRPYDSIVVQCRSRRPGVRPELRLENGTALEQLPRFQIQRPSSDLVVASLTMITENEANMQLVCYYPTGESTRTQIVIQTPCAPGEMMCRDGTCLSRGYFCNGQRECPDGSDEQPPHCEVTTDIEIKPGIIDVQPYQSFQLDCISSNPMVVPFAQFADGRPVQYDQRFRLTYTTPNHLTIRVAQGLTERDHNLAIRCIFPGIGERNATINVRGPCPPGQYQCRDGTCLPVGQFCDGRPSCPDASDESGMYCKVDVTVIPGLIIVKPFETFQFECRASRDDSSPLILVDGEPIENDPRFTVTRPSTERVIVWARQGVPDRGGHIFQCISVTGSRKEVIIRTEPACPSGSYQCQSGQCVPAGAFCDGRFDCPDRSDEDRHYCGGKLIVIPGYINVKPYTSFEFLCESRTPGIAPHVRFVDGRFVESDERFTVTRPTTERVIVRSESGLSEREDTLRMICYIPSGPHKEILIELDSGCLPGYTSCRDGTCLPAHVFCNGRPDCPDGSDEDPKQCVAQITVKPGPINVNTNEPFTYECESSLPGTRPEVTVDGKPIEYNNYFTIQRPKPERIVVTADRGLPEPVILVISCSVRGGTPKEILVTVDSACRSNEFQCRDGTCVPLRAVCDGLRDCSDGSDEMPPRCPDRPDSGTVRFTPGEIRIQPGRPIRLECQTDEPGASVEVNFADGRPLDRRFVVSHPAPNRLVIDVPQGMDANTRQVILICRSSTGKEKNATIYVDQSCQPGQRRCPGGDCIFAGQFCDGRIDCPEGYDERPEICVVCDPIAKPCEPVDGKQPAVSHFQLHWLCDGEDDCGNGFDESNCYNITRNVDPQCGSTTFTCTSGARQSIPFSYWCDGTMDCEGGEDERECAKPSIIEGGGLQSHKVRPGQDLVLECEASGYPPPMIIWRFNWNCLPDESRMITTVVPSPRGCRGSRSRLTIRNFRPGDDGIYNCEALLSNHRAMSQDFIVLLDE